MTLTKAELADILVDKVSNVTKTMPKKSSNSFLKKSVALWRGENQNFRFR